MDEPSAPWDERTAVAYDEWMPYSDEAMIDVLASFARGGRALELGIGSGRVALPLAQRGVDVWGVDNSPAMVDRLRAKPGGARLPVTIGNLADIPIDGPFRLIFAVYGAINQLLTQDEQVRCFQNAAQRLEPDGAFVVEAGEPGQPGALSGVRPGLIEPDRVTLDVSQHDPVSQVVTASHIVLTGRGVELFPSSYRYIWPSEMDLMARLAGLRLHYRCRDWQGTAFDGAGNAGIAVYVPTSRKPRQPPHKRPGRRTG